MTAATVFIHAKGSGSKVPPSVPLETIQAGAYDDVARAVTCVVLGRAPAVLDVLETLGPHAIALDLPDHWPGSSRLDRCWKVGAELVFEVYERNKGMTDAQERLEYLRGEIRAERISYGEIAELESLADQIKPGDVELLEWAGVPEFPDDDESEA